MDGTTGKYRPRSESPVNLNDGKNLDDFEVKIAPDEINGVVPPANGKMAAADDTAETESNDKDKKGKKEKEEKPPAVPLLKLFRFSDKLDVLLMVLGTISAIGHGAAVPLQFIIFGDLINSFIDFDKLKSANVTQPFDLEGQMTDFALYYVYLAIGNMVVAYGQMALWQLTATRQVKKMRLAFFKSVLKQDIGWFDTTDPGELNNRLTEDLNKVADGIGQKIGMFIMSITLVLVGFIMGFAYGWKLTLVIIAVSPLLMIAGGVMAKLLTSFTTKELDAYAKAGSIAEEVLSSIRTVAAFGGEKKEIVRYSSHLGDARDFGIKKGFMSGLGMGFLQVVMFGSYALAFWYGAKLIIDGEMNGGDLLIVFFSVMFGAMQLGQAGPTFEAITTAQGAAYQVFLIIDRVPPIDSSSTDGVVLDHDSFKGNINFNNIELFYPSRPDIKILNSLNLTVDSGLTVALVGESGCGKSTVVKLLQRFYDPSSGEVTIDGHDIRNLNLKWLREQIGVVSQEPVLFATTIAENIRYGKDGVTQENIERATKMANAHDFISRLPQGYDTLVGERGTQLSGGQKQRIAIARALVKDPRILLLDEATSALDSESESIVQAALDQARQGRTTIVIAHRLSTVQNADVIASIQEGVVVEKGSHDELMQTDGVYHQLVTLQTFEEEEKNEEIGVDNDEDVEEKESTAAVNFVRSMSHMSSDSEHEGTEFERQLSTRASRRLSAKKRGNSVLDRPTSGKAAEDKKDKDGEEKILEEDVEPGSVMRIIKMNKSEWPYLVSGSIAGMINGLFPFAFALVLSEILAVFTMRDTDKMKKESEFWSIMFLAIGVASFFANLVQDMSYFDDPLHSTGALTTALGTHASAVQGAAGTRLGTVAMSVSDDGEDELIQSGKIAVETIENIRTVASLGRENTFFCDYARALTNPYKKAMRRAHLQGISFGLSEAFMFFSNAAAFRYGGHLVVKGEMNMEQVMK
ncbi:ABC transporter B member 11 [Desmophyllum pertusum]|uniref:ABC transporter B member 11 n=1 Tax=Desmophyllum pertusum TaxID=174260 RepID=A0A9X0CXE9_9CNID|nr:ABC transporter B member 11 [Desmophyllum pertusum]